MTGFMKIIIRIKTVITHYYHLCRNKRQEPYPHPHHEPLPFLWSQVVPDNANDAFELPPSIDVGDPSTYSAT